MSIPAHAEYRRKVLNAIETLTETVTREQLVKWLPYFHVASWDELIEERSLGNSCGYPLCARPSRPLQKQRYHIDRQSKKIYETCRDRDKFCSDECFDLSAMLREQLFDEPLWMTGEIPERMNRYFKVSENTGAYMVNNSRPIIAVKPQRLPTRGVEVVEEKFVAKMSDLRVCEKDAGSDEDAEEEDDMPHVDEYEKCPDDDIFLDAVQRFVTSKRTNCLPKEEKGESPSEKVPPPPRRVENEEEKLARLRKKYSVKDGKVRGPPIVEPRALIERNGGGSTTRAKETTKALGSCEFEKKSNRSVVDFAKDVLKEWITEECRSALRMGCKTTGGDVESILLSYLSGQKISDVDRVAMPEVDAVDVEKRRHAILLQSLGPVWQELEAKLKISSTNQLLARLTANFSLNSGNITGFSKMELRALVISLWRIVCHMNTEFEDRHFPENCPSQEFFAIARDFGLDMADCEELVDFAVLVIN
ncbi:unnamed protein product [Caenorhabditis auriculariae]|uniref:RNA polymerase II subunit B1 CTD phosphatase RPAP2 homolog n=1 Tax=Caenorhabditis auriculariae TaxID=2777116 RepID=A0A8S1HX68_9PELO|nr:unnamed protein product [Caenorhabditis auriculariae]